MVIVLQSESLFMMRTIDLYYLIAMIMAFFSMMTLFTMWHVDGQDCFSSWILFNVTRPLSAGRYHVWYSEDYNDHVLGIYGGSDNNPSTRTVFNPYLISEWASLQYILLDM